MSRVREFVGWAGLAVLGVGLLVTSAVTEETQPIVPAQHGPVEQVEVCQ